MSDSTRGLSFRPGPTHPTQELTVMSPVPDQGSDSKAGVQRTVSRTESEAHTLDAMERDGKSLDKRSVLHFNPLDSRSELPTTAGFAKQSSLQVRMQKRLDAMVHLVRQNPFTSKMAPEKVHALNQELEGMIDAFINEDCDGLVKGATRDAAVVFLKAKFDQLQELPGEYWSREQRLGSIWLNAYRTEGSTTSLFRTVFGRVCKALDLPNQRDNLHAVMAMVGGGQANTETDWLPEEMLSAVQAQWKGPYGPLRDAVVDRILSARPEERTRSWLSQMLPAVAWNSWLAGSSDLSEESPWRGAVCLIKRLPELPPDQIPALIHGVLHCFSTINSSNRNIESFSRLIARLMDPLTTPPQFAAVGAGLRAWLQDREARLGDQSHIEPDVMLGLRPHLNDLASGSSPSNSLAVAFCYGLGSGLDLYARDALIAQFQSSKPYHDGSGRLEARLPDSRRLYLTRPAVDALETGFLLAQNAWGLLDSSRKDRLELTGVALQMPGASMHAFTLRQLQLDGRVSEVDAEALTQMAGPEFASGMFRVWCSEMLERIYDLPPRESKEESADSNTQAVETKSRRSERVPSAGGWGERGERALAVFKDFEMAHDLYAHLSGLATVMQAVEQENFAVLVANASKISQLLESTGGHFSDASRRALDENPAQEFWGIVQARLAADLAVLHKAAVLCDTAPAPTVETKAARFGLQPAATVRDDAPRWPQRSFAYSGARNGFSPGEVVNLAPQPDAPTVQVQSASSRQVSPVAMASAGNLGARVIPADVRPLDADDD